MPNEAYFVLNNLFVFIYSCKNNNQGDSNVQNLLGIMLLQCLNKQNAEKTLYCIDIIVSICFLVHLFIIAECKHHFYDTFSCHIRTSSLPSLQRSANSATAKFEFHSADLN